jgi:hypothetical protein
VLLRCSSRAAVRDALAASRVELTLPQAQKLCRHLESIIERAVPLRVAIIHAYPSDLLDPWLRLGGQIQRLAVEAFHAPTR